MTLELKHTGPQFQYKHPYCCDVVIHPMFPQSQCKLCGTTYDTWQLVRDCQREGKQGLFFKEPMP